MSFSLVNADGERPVCPKRGATAAPAAVRAVRLLDILAEAPHPLSVSTLTVHLGLPKSSMHGLLTTLVHSGLVTRFEDGSNHLGLHVMDLAHAFLARTDLSAEFVSVWRSLVAARGDDFRTINRTRRSEFASWSISL